MRLDPVFLVAPKPTPPSMPTRRAFLVAGATFSFGVAIGGACGYSVGAARAAAAAPAGEPELESSGDADLDELRRLAVKAPIEELIERRLTFLKCVSREYRRDPVLWTGVERLADAVESDASFPDRRLSARVIAQVMELADADFRARFEVRARALNAIR